MKFDEIVDIRERPEFRLKEGERALAFHVYPDAAPYFQRKGPSIFRTIHDAARQLNIPTYLIVGGDSSLDFIQNDPAHFHLAQLDRPFDAPNLVYIMPSYLHDFWYVDAKGVRNHSSMRAAHFDPDQIDPDKASALFERLRAKFIGANRSKWEQAPIGEEALEQGSAALILQSEKMFPYEERYIDTQELIEASIAARGSRKLYIKPHPKAPIAEQEQLLRYHAPEKGVEISLASIHDLLSHADFMITQSSAVAFEANLHKTPAIISGHVDFGHNAEEITNAAQMAQAVENVLTREFPFERYLYWFLAENLFQTNPLDEERLWLRLSELGFPWVEELRAN